MTSEEAAALGLERLVGAAAMRAAPRVARALSSPAARRGRAALEAAVSRLAAGRRQRGLGALLDPGRHPLAPAAIRVERGRAVGRDGSSEQTAVTLWFGDGPSLPGAATGMRGPATSAVRAGAGVLVTAALAALAAAASRLAEAPPRPARLVAPAEPPRLEAPGAR